MRRGSFMRRVFARDAADRNVSPLASTLPSFQAIYRDYFDFVWSSAARLGVEPSAVDDLVQEVFIVIHEKLHTLENPAALRSWIYGIVRRTASGHRRARRSQTNAGIELSQQEQTLPPPPTPLDQTERNADLQLVARLLEQLDESKREVFALVELDGLKVPEVAEMLEIPLNTAYSRLRLARQAFEAALQRHHARSQGR
jgi:RNA polymerase sigma-70 factor (ECF subfamily)